jgi:alanyl-tRNA synthetase
MKKSDEIRQDFIEFFKKYAHTFVPSSPVVPMDDPTLLFTNAGMNQFKDVFLETGTRSYHRAVNSQKCIRVSGKHNDLEEVGHDTYHHTFFEMLGNWSFGDYFKKETIEWGWKLLTEVWKLPKSQLWATVFAGDKSDNLEADEEAESLWKTVTDINPGQVLRFGKKDNFWEMGDTGPCGPCSEIHIDLGPQTCDKKNINGHKCEVNGDCARFIELWNLVFIQFNRDTIGKLHQLPAKHVDTGMGFERVVAVLQNVPSNYDTDLFKPILEQVGELANTTYGKMTEGQQIASRVIADHIRMLTFSITDGAIPSNEGRGYVLRRILRRAARYARKLDMQDPFIYKLVPTVVHIMGDAFPEVKEKKNYVMEVIKSEEENFNKTLDRGLEIFDGIVNRTRKNKQRQISGQDAFRLYDTYGFPLDLTRIMAEEQNLEIDEAGFTNEMEKQRDRARKAGKFEQHISKPDEWEILNPSANSSKFIGYDTLSTETQIHKLAVYDDVYHLVLNETPFYAESGGQVGDKGKIIGNNFELEVIDTQREGEDIIHVCRNGHIENFDNSIVKAKVDDNLRFPTMYNHTATHLLHAALRRVLGNHVRQAGSLVAPDHLRFDFTHFKKITSEQLEEIERIVNSKIQADLALDIQITEFESAKKKGAMALFGEKYGDTVRMITIGNFSRELCGGTHVKRTGEIGLFLLTEETSVASGIRRIEALTGPKAVEYAQQNRDLSKELSHLLNVSSDKISAKVNELNNQIRVLEKENQKFRMERVLDRIEDLIQNSEKIGNMTFVCQEFHNLDINELKQLGDRLRAITKFTVGFFINHKEGRMNFVCAVTDDIVQNQLLNADELVSKAAKIAGGGGGGRPHLATAGVKDSKKLPEVLKYIRTQIKNNQNQK